MQTRDCTVAARVLLRLAGSHNEPANDSSIVLESSFFVCTYYMYITESTTAAYRVLTCLPWAFRMSPGDVWIAENKSATCLQHYKMPLGSLRGSLSCVQKMTNSQPSLKHTKSLPTFKWLTESPWKSDHSEKVTREKICEKSVLPFSN